MEARAVCLLFIWCIATSVSGEVRGFDDDAFLGMHESHYTVSLLQNARSSSPACCCALPVGICHHVRHSLGFRIDTCQHMLSKQATSYTQACVLPVSRAVHWPLGTWCVFTVHTIGLYCCVIV